MTIQIIISSKIYDAREASRLKKLKSSGFKNIKDLWISDIYTIDKNFTQNQLVSIAKRLSNPVTQEYMIHSDLNKIVPKKKFSYAIEIGFLPGVTDNVSHTVKEIIEDGLKLEFKNGEEIYTSQVTFISGEISKDDAIQIFQSLYNPLIQSAHIKTFDGFIKNGGTDIVVPKVNLVKKFDVLKISLDVSDEDLVKIGKSGIQGQDGKRRGPLALDLKYMKTIQKYFNDIGRVPTDIELESIAQTWSEHCKHTIFADPLDELKEGLYKSYIKKATEVIRKKKGKKDFCVSVFTDNSGGISFDENYLITHKVETHNSPSALDPFGGAITGIVGVNRDTLGFGLSAKPVANFYGFCLADPRLDKSLYRDQKLTQKMLSSRRIMDGVIDGVNAGGNQSGIPTPQGFLYFDERYRGKPLVFAGTVGLIPKKIKGKLSHIKKAMPGDYIVMIGGRVGKDGIHGATFSSEELDSGSPAAAVQIGDPITQKKLSDALVKETRGQLLYSSITDNGAGGLSCSVSEMAKESGGCIVKLEKVPLKYPGLDPWEIWISESQERMTLSVPPKNWKKFHALLKNRGVEATVIGEFTNSGRCEVLYNSKKIMDLDLEFLHFGLPKRIMRSKELKIKNSDIKIAESKNQNKNLSEMLKRLNITSFEFVSEQYDHIVQGNYVLGPLQGRGRVNGDSSVIRPVLSSKKGVIMSHALYPYYSEIDPYRMSAATIDTAIRNVVSTGANPQYIALLDNFCWCSSTDPERLWQLKLAAKACFDTAVTYEAPFISGKDSMFNDFNGFDENGEQIKISIPPTLLISSIGVIDDITKVVSLDAKYPGDLIYILGVTNDELAGSEYFAMIRKSGSTVPSVDSIENKKLYKAFYEAISKNLIASSISVGRGGLGMALIKKAIGGMLGMEVSLYNLLGNVKRDDFALFSESQGRILVTVDPKNKSDFEKLLKGKSLLQIGKITKEKNIEIKGLKGDLVANLDLDFLTDSYRETFKDY